MALLELNYYSKALKSSTVVNVILPERPKSDKAAGWEPDAPYKTLYLFHGLSGNQNEWLRQTCIERYAAKYNLAVVMPNARPFAPEIIIRPKVPPQVSMISIT